MFKDSSDVVSRLRPTGYLVGVLLLIIPLIETATSTWPFVYHAAIWRYGTLGALAGFMAVQLVGVLLVLSIAILTSDASALWLTAVVCFAEILVCFGGAAVVASDSLTLRAKITGDLASRFAIGSGWSVGKLVLCGVAFVTLFASALRELARLRKGAARRDAPGEGVRVGNARPPAPPLVTTTARRRTEAESPEVT